MSKLITVFRAFPKDIFRANKGPQIQLREYFQGLRVYDIHVTDGRVMPLAPDCKTFQSKQLP